MPRADKRYTAGLMERLNRTIPNTEGRAWILDRGKQSIGHMWRVCEAKVVTIANGQTGPYGGHYNDIARGVSERDLQNSLGAYLDGYDAGTRDQYNA